MPNWIPSLSLVALAALCSAWPAGGQGAAKAAPAAEGPKNVQELLACLDRAAGTLQDYTVTGITEANGKSERFQMTFKRPTLVRIDTSGGQVAVQPNGEIKGRLGHGPFGRVAQKLGRDDGRLKDAEGIPFYESDFLSMLERIRTQIRAGAAATMRADRATYVLELRSGDTAWRYRFSGTDFSLLESSRLVRGQQVESTRYTAFHANVGITVDRFRF